MSLIASSIVGGVYEQKSIVNGVRADDWTAKLVIIASNELLSVFSIIINNISYHLLYYFVMKQLALLWNFYFGLMARVCISYDNWMLKYQYGMICRKYHY